MGVLITTVDVGDVVIQGGHGVPNHIATRGTLYVDFDTGIQYINKNGIALWGAMTDTIILSGFTDVYVTGGTFNEITGVAIFTNNTGGTFNVTGLTTPFSGGTFNLPVVFTSGLTANTIFVNSLTANSAFINSFSATTISATTYLGLPTDIRVTGGTIVSGTTTFINNTGGTFDVTGFNTDNIVNISNISGASTSDALDKTTVWRGNWVQDVYVRNQQVIDGSFLAIANKTTEDRPAPQPIGTPAYIYSGSISATSVSAKQVIFGNRYQFNEHVFLEGWRVNIIAGNNYSVYLVESPVVTPIITQIIQFTAQNSGWQGLNLSKTLITSGSTYDLIVTVSEPDPTPTTFTGNWDYEKPNNPSVPSSGQITHANKTLGILRIHKIDNDSNNRASQLSGLSIGDIITITTTRWAIQATTDSGTYFEYSISPAIQLASVGVKNFTFETITSTPITVPFDPNYWLNSPPLNIIAQGLLGVDTPYTGISTNNTAYGVDLLVREILPSPDWDLQAFTSVVSSNSGSGLYTVSGVMSGNSAVFSYNTVGGYVVSGMVNTATTININGVVKNLNANREWLTSQGNTGILDFSSGLTLNNSTAGTINIAAMYGYIVDNETNPAIPTHTFVSYSGTPASGITVSTRNSGIASYLLLNTSGTPIFQNTFPTSAQRKQNIWLGKIAHPLTGTITTVINEPDYITSPSSKVNDLFQAINYINDGVYPYYSGANLNFNITNGNIHGNGINLNNSRLIPNEVQMGPFSNGTPFVYRTQTGGTSTAVSAITPSSYDVGGVITAVGGGAGASTIQWIFCVPGAGFVVQYGQTQYTSLATAIAAIGREQFIVFPNLIENAILIGVLAVNKTATNLSDSTQAQFFRADKFGQIIGAQAGISTTNLQDAYNNSLQPQFVITSLGALQIQSNALAANIFQGLNTAGTATFTVNGLGGVTANTVNINTIAAGTIVNNLAYDSTGRLIIGSGGGGSTFTGGTVTGPTNFLAGLTSTTISATTYLGLPTDVFVTGGTFNQFSSTIIFTNSTGGTFNVTGVSVFTGGTVTGATRFTNGLTANTISATTYLGLPTDIRVTGGTFTGTSNNIAFTNNTGGTFNVTGVSRALQYYAEFSSAPANNPTVFSADSIALGDGAEARAIDMFVYGRNAGANATGTTDAIFMGVNAGNNADDTFRSVFIGRLAGDGATDSNEAVFIGFGAGDNADRSADAIFIGTSAGERANDSDRGVFIGDNAGNGASGASFSNLIGFQAGLGTPGNFIGTHNTIIGTNLSLPNATTRGLNIGGVLFGRNLNNDAVGGTVTGATSTGRIGINVPIPTQALEVSGNSRFYGSITANTLVKSGGTNVQFLMADGSVSLGFTGGTLTGNTIFNNITANTIFTTGLTANTVSATTYLGLPTDIRVTGGTFTGVSNNIVFTNNSGGTFSVTGVSRALQYYSEYSGAPTTNPIATGTDSIALGDGARALSNDMAVWGRNAGVNATGATDSIFMGNRAGNGATGASDSVFIGHQAGDGATGTSDSVLIGHNAGLNGYSNSDAILIGLSAGANATDTIQCIFIGRNAGNQGDNNSISNFIGYNAGSGAIDNTYSNFIGFNAGLNASGTTYANFMSRLAGASAHNVDFSNFFGFQAGADAVGAGSSNFFGSQAGYIAVGANNSNFFGGDAGNGATGASFSNFIGYQAGKWFSGNNVSTHNTIIGTNITLPDATTRGLNIGGVLFGRNLYSTTSGNPNTGATSTGRIGINVPIPTQALEVSGNSRFYGSITANTIVKSGGTSAQYLMADGSTSTGQTGNFWSAGTGNTIFNTNVTGFVNIGATNDTTARLVVSGAVADAQARVVSVRNSGVESVFINGTGKFVTKINLGGFFFQDEGTGFLGNSGNSEVTFRSFSTGNGLSFDPQYASTNFVGNNALNIFNQTYTIAPTANGSRLRMINLEPTVNHTGTYTGVTHGIRIAPTLTSVFDFRAIEVTTGRTILDSLTARTITATTISATTYLGLPPDVYVTGGTFSSSSSTIIFTNTTGGTFNVTGITVSSTSSGSFSGGTVTGATIFTGGLSANTFSATSITGVSISATTYLGLPAGAFSGLGYYLTSGTTNFIPKFLSGTTVANSRFTDDGSQGRYSDVGSNSTVQFLGGHWLSLTRSQASLFFDIGNPQILQTGDLTSDNTYGFNLKSAGFTRFSVGSAYTQAMEINGTIFGLGNVGIGISASTGTGVTTRLSVSGNSRFISSQSGTTFLISSNTQNTLTVIGSGNSNTSPIFSVQGSQGELFSVSDSLIGSLFSVNDISGLPVLEVFSDDTILMGNYLAPALNTTVKILTTAGTNNIYSFPTSAYTGAWVDYTVMSGTNLRAGSIMSVFNSASTQYTETSTNDIGNTSGITFSMVISGSNALLRASGVTSGWTVKSIIRSI